MAENSKSLLSPSEKSFHSGSNFFSRKVPNNSHSEMSAANCNFDGVKMSAVVNEKRFHSAVNRVFEAIYYGSITLDRRYTPAMLPWLVAEVKRRGQKGRPVRLQVKEHVLKCYSLNGNVIWLEHHLSNIYRFIQTLHNKKCFAYLIKDATESATRNCYVFEVAEESMVQDLFTIMKEASRELHGNQSSIQTTVAVSTSGCSSSDNGAQRFELLYVGKIKVSHRKPPPTFIDEAVEKFRVLELEKLKHQHEYGAVPDRKRHGSGTSVASLPPNLEHFVSIRENELEGQVERLGGSESDTGSGAGSSVENLTDKYHHHHFAGSAEGSVGSVIGNDKVREPDEGVKLDSSIVPTKTVTKIEPAPHGPSKSSESSPISSSSDIVASDSRGRSFSTGHDCHRGRSDSIASGQNRTMVFQIGKTDISLISLDKKLVILSKPFKDISHCSQGIKHTEHFGFICRDANAETYLGYILRCQSETVTEEILTTLKQAFASAAAQQRSLRNQFLMCDACPMLWLHKLCLDLEGLSASKAYGVILRRLESLAGEEKSEILTKLQGAEVSSTQEQNEILMMLLRALCETKQSKHVHTDSQGRLEALAVGMLDKKHQSVLDDLKNKAKRSLTSSFENILKRRSKDDAREAFRERSNTIDADTSSYRDSSDCATPEQSPSSTPDRKEGSYDFLEGIDENNPFRRRSSTIGGSGREQSKKHPHSKLVKQKTSPMMNIFMKVGNASKPTTPVDDEKVAVNNKGSWRQAIFNRVVTPQHKPLQAMSNTPHKVIDGFPATVSSPAGVPVKRSPSTLRSLWRKAILQQILLIRMEKENKKLKASQDAADVKRLKLSYEEITPCLKEVTKVWEEMLRKDSQSEKLKFNKLIEAVKAGVPRQRRGEIWQLLASQHNLRSKRKGIVPEEEVPPNYEELLKQLTAQQHAILIDLGRTFPNHPYFSAPLGAGQLSLFNLLKAYSLLDKEVGYCQGLSFIAGVLLLHMEEDRAFDLLKHILFTLRFRHQFKPDMIALQIQMYQLSRLIHDQHRDLYEHFERHEIAPTLYAAPWFLTLFASQFPLGFVARVFDLIFLYGVEVVFKVALALLGNHKELIIQCATFESVMDFLKTTLPSMGIIQMERVINQVFTLDITKELHAYEVEYHVIQEEFSSSPPRGDFELLSQLEATNRNLKRQNKELLEELQATHSNIRCLERNISSYQACTSRYESRLKTLELEKTQLKQLVEELKKNWPRNHYDSCADIFSNYRHIMRSESPTSSPLIKPVPVTNFSYRNMPASPQRSIRSYHIEEENAVLNGTSDSRESSLSPPKLRISVKESL